MIRAQTQLTTRGPYLAYAGSANLTHTRRYHITSICSGGVSVFKPVPRVNARLCYFPSFFLHIPDIPPWDVPFFSFCRHNVT